MMSKGVDAYPVFIGSVDLDAANGRRSDRRLMWDKKLTRVDYV